MKRTREEILIPAGILALAALVCLQSFNSNRFGYYHDDGIYVVSAKALATGQGYRILSLPDQPWQTKYPPVFSYVLSLLWRAKPVFPDNLVLLTSLSIMSTLTFLGLSIAFLIKHGYATRAEALLILILAAFNWRTIVLATSILSEPLYAVLTICVLWLASYRGKRIGSLPQATLGIAMSLTALTRLSGLALVAAVILHALFNKQTRRILLPTLLSLSAVAAWFWWCHLHQSSVTGSQEMYYTSYFQDWRNLLQISLPAVNRSFWGATSLMVGKNVLALLAEIPVVCLGLAMNWYEGLPEGMLIIPIIVGLTILTLLVAGLWRARSVGGGLLHYYILLYILLHLLWPYSLYDRFLFPLLPFLLAFIVAEARHRFSLFEKGARLRQLMFRPALFVFSFLLLPVILGVAVYEATYGLYKKIGESKTFYAAVARRDDALINWLRRNSEPSDIIACYRDPVYYLYANRKAVRLPTPSENENISKAGPIVRFVDENNVKYLVTTDTDFDLDTQSVQRRLILRNMFARHRTEFIPVFHTQDGLCAVYRTHLEPQAYAH